MIFQYQSSSSSSHLNNGPETPSNETIEKKIQSTPKLPKTITEADANWKNLCKQLNITNNPTRNKPKNGKITRKDIWFDDVDECLIDDLEQKPSTSKLHPLTAEKGSGLLKEKSFSGLTKAIGMDCEMVGVGDKGAQSILGRVSLVNHFGHKIYDEFVKPTEPVTDYRTQFSGLRPENLATGKEFQVVQKEVCDLLKGRILVGHAVKNDLKVLYLSHPKQMIRDTSKYFRFMFGNRVALKKLTEKLLHVNIQSGEHDSVEDAQATMKLYTLYKKRWETKLKKERIRNKSS